MERSRDTAEVWGRESSRPSTGSGLTEGALEPGARDFEVVAVRHRILHADEQPRRLTHTVCDDRLFDPPDVGFRKGRPPPRHLIQVTAGNGVVPRVEPVGHNFGTEDVDVGRQLVVEPAWQ